MASARMSPEEAQRYLQESLDDTKVAAGRAIRDSSDANLTAFEQQLGTVTTQLQAHKSPKAAEFQALQTSLKSSSRREQKRNLLLTFAPKLAMYSAQHLLVGALVTMAVTAAVTGGLVGTSMYDTAADGSIREGFDVTRDGVPDVCLNASGSGLEDVGTGEAISGTGDSLGVMWDALSSIFS